MLTQRPPYADFESMAAIYKIATEDHPQYKLPNNVSKTCYEILQLTFKKNHKDRPTAEDLLRHRFVSGLSWSLYKIVDECQNKTTKVFQIDSNKRIVLLLKFGRRADVERMSIDSVDVLCDERCMSNSVNNVYLTKHVKATIVEGIYCKWSENRYKYRKFISD